ncbi:MAG: hypothetical protein QNJ37_06870 [Crocosphaera sp.]|nr:hypothetical protein [Crocosphaera sp.]
MINYFCIFCYGCLNFWLFSGPVRGEFVNKNKEQGTEKPKQIKYLKTNQTRYVAESELIDQEENENNINIDNSPNIIDQGNFITGLWRGFHQSEGLRVYYGYQFRPDGSFVARHRIYQDREILEDITWQGEWQFRNDILKIKAFNSKDKNQQATLEFKLTDTFKLAYETGSLSDAYQGIILNKLGY